MSKDREDWREFQLTKKELFELSHRVVAMMVAGTFGSGILIFASRMGASVHAALWILIPVGMPYALAGLVKWRRNREAEPLNQLYEAPAHGEE